MKVIHFELSNIPPLPPREENPSLREKILSKSKKHAKTIIDETNEIRLLYREETLLYLLEELKRRKVSAKIRFVFREDDASLGTIRFFQTAKPKPKPKILFIKAKRWIDGWENAQRLKRIREKKGKLT